MNVLIVDGVMMGSRLQEVPPEITFKMIMMGLTMLFTPQKSNLKRSTNPRHWGQLWTCRHALTFLPHRKRLAPTARGIGRGGIEC